MEKPLMHVPEVLNIIFKSLPANAGDFIKWVAEVRRQEEDEPRLSMEEKERLAVKEEVLQQVHETELYLNLSQTSCFLRDHVVQICCLLAIKNCYQKLRLPSVARGCAFIREPWSEKKLLLQ